MPISLVGTASASSSTAVTEITVNVPAGTQDGDLLRVVLSSTANTTQATPSGWSLWKSASQTALSMFVWYRWAASEPASYTFTGLTSTRHAIVAMSHRGVDPTNPADVAVSNAVGGTTAVGFSTVTPVTAGAWGEGLAAMSTASGAATGTASSTNLTIDAEAISTAPAATNCKSVVGHLEWTSGSFLPNMSNSTTTARTAGITSVLRPATSRARIANFTRAAAIRSATR